MTLRDYQQQGISNIRSSLSRVQSVLYVAPCGAGKGSLCAYVINGAASKGKSVIFAVHGVSLCADMDRRVTKLGIDHGVLVGGRKRDHRHRVQVASIDTLHRMEHPPEADLIICDEADMTGSPTWKKALGRYPKAKIIGLTATPIRLDGKGLGRSSGGLFDEMIVGPSELELIRRGYLVDSRVFIGKTPEIPTEARHSDKKLAQVCDKATIIGDIVVEWKKISSTKKTLAFGIDCAHAQHIRDSFNAASIPWAYVDADTPQAERDRIWYDLEHTNLMGASNVGIATVGFDCPVIQCLIMARFTESLRLWRQMLGRGSRPYSGKTEFLVMDHVGCTTFHSPNGFFADTVQWSLEGDAVREVEGVSGPQVTQCWGPPVSMDVLDEESLIEGATKAVRKFPCNQKFRTGPRECPFCGYPLPVNRREVEVLEGEMQELSRSAFADRPEWFREVPIAEKKRFLYQMIAVAKKIDNIRTDARRKAFVEKRFRQKFAAEVNASWWPAEWMRTA